MFISKEKKLAAHPYAKCKLHYIVDGHGGVEQVTLRSYDRYVVMVDYDHNTTNIHCNGTYSATTRRHISWFLKEIGSPLNYYDIKQIAGKYVYLSSDDGKLWKICDLVTCEVIKEFTK